MRRWIALCLATVGLATAATANAQADFDPSGRRRAPRGASRTARPVKRPASKKRPSDDALIERYTQALLGNPSSPFPLQKLTELYRGRDGNLDALIADFEKRAASASGEERYQVELALAGVYLTARKRDQATRLLDELAKLRPSAATPYLMRATLAEREGDPATARRYYESAVPLLRDATERERVTRQLMLLALDANDLVAATARHVELVRSAGGSIFVRRELGVELMNRGNFAAAEAQFRELVKATSGDNRALAPALRDLGESLARQKKLEEAHDVLDRARVAAGAQSGLRNEILAILTDVYREQGRLEALVEILERESGRDAARLMTLAQLLEELGKVDLAILRYREALALGPRNIEARTRLVHLLQSAGLLEDAVREYEALIKAAPDSVEHVFELAETRLQRGEPEKALQLLLELERRSAKKPDVLASIADFYDRAGEQARALKVFEKLTALPEGDPRHLIDLGDRYFQAGDRERAIATWRRVLAVSRSRAEGLQTFGEVLFEHDMTDEALTQLREAVQAAPKGREERFKKALAGALERAGTNSPNNRARFREALSIWQEIHSNAGADDLLKRECRNHLVNVWGLLRELDAQVRPLTSRLERDPPDLEAGRLLGEVLRRLGKISEAESVLRKVVSLAPGDVASMLALERALVQQRNLGGAIDILTKIIEADPQAAREHYQRMAQYAAELYRDEDAIDYASRALELSPGDAEGHYRLAALLRRKQQHERAAVELRKAILKNSKMFAAYFELAELVVARGDVEEADRLYRTVIRTARDEEFVIRAARLSMQLHLGKGTLEVLERDLLPLALGNPQRPAYRRMLVELYGNLTAPLVRTVRSGSGTDLAAARERLAVIGSRAVKPLLDSLLDDRAAQQRIAIDVLSHVENKSASPALFTFATSNAAADLRARAMIACGTLADPQMLPRYEALLAPAEGDDFLAPSEPVALAATWGVTRMAASLAGGKDSSAIARVDALLLKLVESTSVEIRAMAALGLGFGGRAAHAPTLARLARSPEAGTTVRAAAVAALGELGSSSERATILALADAAEPELQRAAFGALSRIEFARSDRSSSSAATLAPDVAAVIARGFWSASAEVRAAALSAAAALVTGRYDREYDGRVSQGAEPRARALVAQMSPSRFNRSEQLEALGALKSALGEAAKVLVAASPRGAAVVATLLAREFESELAPVEAERTPADSAPLRELSQTVTTSTLEAFAALVRHPDEEVRRHAVEVVARRSEPVARDAVRSALDPGDPETCRAALASLREDASGDVRDAVVLLLTNSSEWTLRAVAAETLGRLARPRVDGADRVDEALRRVTKGDSYAIVREAALRALFARGAPHSNDLAREVELHDDEPHVREVAADLRRRAGVHLESGS